MTTRKMIFGSDSAGGRTRLTLNGKELFVDNAEQLIARVQSLIEQRKSVLVVTLNSDHVLRGRSDPRYSAIIEDADLLVLDGMPLVLLARALGVRGVHRQTGADLLPMVARQAAERNWRVVLTGGRSEISAQAVSNLNRLAGSEAFHSVEFPMIDSMADQRSSQVIDEIRRATPNVVFLCLGSPKQELWFQHWRAELSPAVYVGAGAAVDFAAGTVQRAPRWVQRASLEWAWRLAQEPRRLGRRYLVRGPLLTSVVVQSFVARIIRRP